MNPLTCERTDDLIVAMLDGSAAEKDRFALERHLSHCAECRAKKESYAELLDHMISDRMPAPDETFWKHYDTSLQAKLSEKDRPAPWILPWRAAALFATGCLVLIITAVGVLGPLVPTPVPTPGPFPMVMEELQELYGPGRDEILHTVSVVENGIPFLTGDEVFDDTPLNWFEVEDDPPSLFL